MALARMVRRRVESTGFWMKSYAPFFMASTAESIEPCAVSMTTAILSAAFSQAGEQLQAIHARHLEVGNDDAGLPRAHFFQSLEAVAGGFRAIAPSGDKLGQAREGVRLVFDDENLFLTGHGLGVNPGDHGLLYHF